MSTTSAPIFKCPSCDVTYPTQKALTVHIEQYRHYYWCLACKRAYSSEDARKAHYRDSKAHPNCTICKLGFQDAGALAVHNAAFHISHTPQPVVVRPVPVLPVASTPSTLPAASSSKLAVASSPRLPAASSSASISPSPSTSSMPSSSTPPPVVAPPSVRIIELHDCVLCGKDFSTKDALKEHQLTAHEQYCKTCDRIFYSASEWTLHVVFSPGCRRPATAESSRPVADSSTWTASSSSGSANTSSSSAPVMISSPSSDGINSSLAEIVPSNSSAPTPNEKGDATSASSPNVKDELDETAPMEIIPRCSMPSAPSPQASISKAQNISAFVVSPPAAVPAEPWAPTVITPRTSSPFTVSVAPNSSKSSTRSSTPSHATNDHPAARPLFTKTERVVSPKPSPLAHPVPHVSYRPRSVSSVMDGSDHEEISRSRERTPKDRPVSWMSLGVPRSESRASPRHRQMPRPRAAASDMREAAARNAADTRGARYVSHIYCRSCRRDPCVDVTATMCGHIFCNKCITDAVIESSQCPACCSPILLYSLFKLHLQ
ncbi:hypothetical protein DENSPDRAFT_839415 [Dentipellis sp. KUC8613]|nr:hypothetical protein DENSPDRAFT_839415 [Dentipellis sp. KUC8613]